MDKEVEKYSINSGEIKKLLLYNGFDSFMETPTINFEGRYTKNNLKNLLETESSKYDINLPEENYWPLFFKIGSGDFDAAYLYSPKFEDYAISKDPTMQELENIVKGMTKITPHPIITYSELDRFAIPKMQIFQNGKETISSEIIGKETYSEDYWKKDEEKYRERATDFINKMDTQKIKDSLKKIAR